MVTTADRHDGDAGRDPDERRGNDEGRSARESPSKRHERAPRTAVVIAAALAATVLGSLFAKYAFGAWLGVPLPPFYLFPRLAIDLPWAIAAVAALAAGAAWAPRLRSSAVPPPVFAAALLALGLVLRLLLAAASVGTRGWYAPFGPTLEAQNEYIPALPALDLGWRPFLDRFAELAATLPIHPSVHPPGLLLTMDLLEVTTPYRMAALMILGGALSLPLVYVLARQLLDEGRARTAALMFVFAPNALLFGVSGTDAFFVTLGLLATIGLLARGVVGQAVGSAMLALASFFSFSLLGVGAWAVFVRALRRGVLPAVGVAALAGVVLVAFYALLWVETGYSLFGNLEAANYSYHIGVYDIRPYLYWVIGSPAAWMVAIGLPITWYALRSLSLRGDAALALAAVVVIASVGGYTKSETERIWQFLVPFACIAAATTLPVRRTSLVLLLLAAQALLTELLFDTKW